MFLVSHFIKQILDTIILVTNKWQKLIYSFSFIKEINGKLDTKMIVTSLISIVRKLVEIMEQEKWYIS